jgi:IclR family transcriptional regulator, KDG regulon repressor
VRDMVSEGEKTTYSSKVLDRVMMILNTFTSVTPELTFTELIEQTSLHKSTLFRLLEAMRSYGLIEVSKVSGKYHLGLRFFDLGALAIGRLEIRKCADAELEWLAEQSGETAHLCILDGAEIVYISKVESRQALRIPSGVGHRNPAYCTGVGKAILAFLDDEQIEKYLAQIVFRPLTDKTITCPEKMWQEIKSIRQQGYAIDDQEINENVRCIGAPIRDFSGKVIAGISIAGPAIRVTKSRVPELAVQVVKAANKISKHLGYRMDEVLQKRTK